MDKIGILRKIKDSEIETIRLWRNEPEVRKNMYTKHEISQEEHQKWWESVLKKEDQKYFIYENKEGIFGVVSFSEIDKKNNNCSWAFYSSPDAAIGTGTKMEVLALDYAFNEMKLHKINCEVLEFNKSVVKLHEKFGFKIEGILRQQHKANEKFIDVYKMGLLKEEWKDKRGIIVNKLNSYFEGRNGK